MFGAVGVDRHVVASELRSRPPGPSTTLPLLLGRFVRELAEVADAGRGRAR